MNTPVVLIIFNRPETTRRALETIRQAEPRRLFVIADGPRADVSTDSERCTNARAIIDAVDWDCDIFKDYSESNLGCALRVSSGLDRVFSQVPEAIILEDDCIADPSFFPYCQELLDRYRNEPKIMTIAGTNVQFGRNQTEYSYYFSRYVHSWGWATWRRAWQYYDHDMSQWQEMRDSGRLVELLGNRNAAAYWRKIFNRTELGKFDSWAYRWMLASWVQNGLNVIPSVNLVSNIGFGASATHTQGKSIYDTMETESLEFPLCHPPQIRRHEEADEYTQATLFRTPSLSERIRYRTAKLLQQIVPTTQKSS